MAKKDITGLKFNKLTVIEYFGKSKHGAHLWKCKCECGKEVVVQNSKLTREHTTSCGCARGEALRKDLLGRRFGRLVVTKFNSVGLGRLVRWDCKCDCGKTGIVSSSHLIAGRVVSCGCYQRERAAESSKTHGLTKHPLFWVFRGMVQRCENSNSSEYHNYGGRGISICPEWRTNFEEFYKWSIENGYRKGLSIDRYPDKDGNYEPGNCRWATPAEQSRNKRNMKLTIDDARNIKKDPRLNGEIAKEYGLSESYVNAIKNNLYWKE